MARGLGWALAAALAGVGTSARGQPGVTAGNPDADSPSALTGVEGQDAAGGEAELDGETISAALAERLRGLSPADPRAYLMLGEEVAAEARGPGQVGLARTLYVLAFELDRRRRDSGASGDPGLAASACLALADLSRLEEDRRWLVALARSIDRRYASPDWSRAAQPSYSGEAGFEAAEFLGLVRSGDGHRARDLLAKPEVSQVLEEYERMVGGLGSSGMLRSMELESRQWPCRQCGNLRVARLGETNPPRKGICPTCRGNPGPTLDRSALIAQLRFESGLLDGIQSSWSAQMTLDQGAPLREPSASELAPTMGVDADAVYWRGGSWVKMPDREGESGADRPLQSGPSAGGGDRGD